MTDESARYALILFLLILGSGTTAMAQPECDHELRGRVIHAASGSGIPDVVVRLDGKDRATFTDPGGRFRIGELCAGFHEIEVVHVAFVLYRSRVDVQPGRETLTVRLAPRSYRTEEFEVRIDGVRPLTSLERRGVSIPSASIDEFASRDIIDAMAMAPGVTVTADRLFFRGIGFEQVQPVIDGVPARAPLTGEWVLPPPQAVSSAELLSGAMIAESPSSLGGVVAFRLAEGGDQHKARLTVGANGLGSVAEADRRIDFGSFSASGPTAIPELTYSTAWQGRVDSGSSHFDRAEPSQTALGLLPLGHRMSGRESGSFKLTWTIPQRSMKVGFAVIGTRSRGKTYRHHYSKSGWVRYIPRFDRYSGFLDNPSNPDDLSFYRGPEAIPRDDRRSVLVLTTIRKAFPSGSWLAFHAEYGHHRLESQPEGRRIETDDALRQWVDHELTDPSHQEDPFYAVHGDFSEFHSGVSDEIGLGSSGAIRLGQGHKLGFGAGLTYGAHQYAWIAPPRTRGTFDRRLRALEVNALLEDTWYSDKRSWMQVALRLTSRRLQWGSQSWNASRIGPALAFHQPMTHTDAIHVEAGASYQFPTFRGYFPEDPDGQGVTLQTQRLRFVEVGLQHHFSSRAVLYLGAYEREYVDVVFSNQSPTEAEAAFGSPTRPPPDVVEARGLEAILDHRFHRRLTGQFSAILSRALKDDDVETAWSRRWVLRNWVSWQMGRSWFTTLTTNWDSGRPYSVCLRPRGCADFELREGTLPSPFDADLAIRWSPRVVSPSIDFRVEIYNVLDRRVPSYEFSVYPTEVSVENFLAYYHDTGRTGGYARQSGNGTAYHELDNPETRTAGRSFVVGVSTGF